MKILLTGNEGFVGSHIQQELDFEMDIVGLDVRAGFQEWYDDMIEVMASGIDAVVHVGANSSSQSQDADLYLWNSYASFLIAREAARYNTTMPFVLFSSFFVNASESDWENRGIYAWTKAQSEDFVSALMPH